MPHKDTRGDFEGLSKLQPVGICNFDQQPFKVEIQRVIGNAVVFGRSPFLDDECAADRRDHDLQ